MTNLLLPVVIAVAVVAIARMVVGDSLNGGSRRLLRSIAATLKRTKELSTIRCTRAPTAHTLLEICRSLEMHELVLLRIDDVDKNKQAKLVGSELAVLTNSSLVQTLGHTALLYKPANSPDSVVAAMMQAETRPKQ